VLRMKSLAKFNPITATIILSFLFAYYIFTQPREVEASPDLDDLRPDGSGYSTQWNLTDSTHAGATNDNSDLTYVSESDNAGEGSVEALTLDDVPTDVVIEAVGKYGFKPEEVFFDSTIFPLAIDMPMQPGEPSYTYKTFETIKKIKGEPGMRGVHFIGGITNCARDLPGRKIGVMRAYVHKAMQYGMDAGIVNVKHHLSEGEADAELLQLVDAFAKMDGSAERMNEAMALMSKFCQECRESGK